MVRNFKQYYGINEIILFAGDSLIILVGIFLAAVFRFDSKDFQLTIFWIMLPKALLITLVCQSIFYFNSFYDLSKMVLISKLASKLAQSLGAVCILLCLVYLVLPTKIINRTNLIMAIMLIATLISAWRFLFHILLKSRKLLKRIVIVGTGNLAKQVAHEINKQGIGIDLLGFIGNGQKEVGNIISNPMIIGTYDQLFYIAERCKPVTMVVAIDDRRNGLPLEELLACRLKGVCIEDHVTFLEKITGRLMVDNLKPSHLIFCDGFKKLKWLIPIKRVIEIVLSILLLVILLPLIFVIAIFIRIESKKPIIFRQERVGLNGKSFTLYKFKSMKNGAEMHSGPVWAKEGDNRVTRVGRYIRKYRLDEILQLWNVIKGDVSFVGPRPERPYFVEKLRTSIPYYDLRHSVKPGITGWAQIRHPYGASQEDALEKLKYDLYFIKNLSVFFELLILFETIKVVLGGKGAR